MNSMYHDNMSTINPNSWSSHSSAIHPTKFLFWWRNHNFSMDCLYYSKRGALPCRWIGRHDYMRNFPSVPFDASWNLPGNHWNSGIIWRNHIMKPSSKGCIIGIYFVTIIAMYPPVSSNVGNSRTKWSFNMLLWVIYLQMVEFSRISLITGKFKAHTSNPKVRWFHRPKKGVDKRYHHGIHRDDGRYH